MSYLRTFPSSKELSVKQSILPFYREKRLLRIKSKEFQTLSTAVIYVSDIYNENGERWGFFVGKNLADKERSVLLGLRSSTDNAETFIGVESQDSIPRSPDSHFESFFKEISGKVNYLNDTLRECTIPLLNGNFTFDGSLKFKMPIPDGKLEVLEVEGGMPVIMTRIGYTITYALPYGIGYYKRFSNVRI